MCRSGLLILLLQPALAAEPDIIAQLQEHRAKFPSLTATFTEQKTTSLLQKPIITRGTIAFRAPNFFRREITGSNPSLTVCDGSQLWIHYPNFNEAERYALGQHSFFDDSLAALTAGLNFQDITKFYRTETFREPPGHRLRLLPKTSGLKRILRQLDVWITADFLIAKTEATLPNGDRVATTYAGQRSRPVPDSTFEFKPPPGVRITSPLGK